MEKIEKQKQDSDFVKVEVKDNATSLMGCGGGSYCNVSK